tara:strand:- start:509 stop:724 length:216 start_codon:yes stop_codon:yes gene_type:complete
LRLGAGEGVDAQRRAEVLAGFGFIIGRRAEDLTSYFAANADMRSLADPCTAKSALGRHNPGETSQQRLHRT